MQKQIQQSNSHSTMYLLKPQCVTNLIGGNLNSHSTMYLLKPLRLLKSVSNRIVFTFHHVSIKTLYPLQIPLP